MDSKHFNEQNLSTYKSYKNKISFKNLLDIHEDNNIIKCDDMNIEKEKFYYPKYANINFENFFENEYDKPLASKSTLYSYKPNLELSSNNFIEEELEQLNLVGNYKTNFFDISDKTKNILDQILNNKKKSDKYKTSNNEYKNKYNNMENNELDNLMIKYKSILIKKEEETPPIISQSTKNIIDKIKNIRNNKLDDYENNNNNNNIKLPLYSLKFKYEELEKRKFLIPIKYKIILKAFSSLEQAISLTKLNIYKKVLNSFDNLKNNIEKVTNHTFDYKMFQQILYIVPHFYILKYI